MSDIRSDVAAAVGRVLQEWGIADSVDPIVELSARPEFGDFSTPAPLRAARARRMAPMAIAEEMRERLTSYELPSIAGWTVSSPGYVNCHVVDARWAPDVMAAALSLDSSVAVSAPRRMVDKGRTLVEHTATNPNKAAHIGHLRNACIGDCVVRMLRRTGGEVEVNNYIDDTGVQVADVAVGLRHLGYQQEPNEAFDSFCSRVYVQVGRRYEQEPALLDIRRQTLHQIEAGDNEVARFVKELANRIVDCHLTTMGRFDIRYDLLTWESDIIALGFWRHAFELLRAAGAAVHVDQGKHAGCWVMPTDDDAADDDDAKVLVKSDGVATYTAKDIAYQLWKFGLLGRDFNYRRWDPQDHSSPATTTSGPGGLDATLYGRAARVINVVDARQAYPQRVVRRALAKLGHQLEAARSIHLGYEVVALSATAAAVLGLPVQEGKNIYAFSGRRGIEVRADELLDRAVEAVAIKARDTASAVLLASGAVRYYLQKFTLNQVIVFDFDEALRTTGDTGTYLMYTHARAAGILRRVPEELMTAVPALHPAERALLHAVDSYRYALHEAADGLSPATLCTYTLGLAAAFTDFYEHTPPIAKEQDALVRAFRRRLVACAKAVLADALHCLGLSAPEEV